MARAMICDICKKQTTQIVEKLLITPTPKHGKSMHSNYTHHCDVGICCTGRIKNLFNFKPRRTREQYNKDRKKASGFQKELERDGKPVAAS